MRMFGRSWLHIIFRLNKAKNDIRRAYEQFCFFHVNVNSHNLEIIVNHIAHAIFVLHIALWKHTDWAIKTHVLSKYFTKLRKVWKWNIELRVGVQLEVTTVFCTFCENIIRLQKLKKLNPLRARWPMDPALISGFCSVKPPDESLRLPLNGTLIHRRLAPSRCWYSFTYPGRMETWVGLGGKEGHSDFLKSRQIRDRTGDLGIGKQRSANHSAQKKSDMRRKNVISEPRFTLCLPVSDLKGTHFATCSYFFQWNNL